MWYSNVLVKGVFPGMKHPMESITCAFLWTLRDTDIENADMLKKYMPGWAKLAKGLTLSRYQQSWHWPTSGIFRVRQYQFIFVIFNAHVRAILHTEGYITITKSIFNQWCSRSNIFTKSCLDNNSKGWVGTSRNRMSDYLKSGNVLAIIWRTAVWGKV